MSSKFVSMALFLSSKNVARGPPKDGSRPARGESYLELVCVPRWNASSLTFSVRSICVKVCAIEA